MTNEIKAGSKLLAQTKYCLQLLLDAAKENRVPNHGVIAMSEHVLNSLKPKDKV